MFHTLIIINFVVGGLAILMSILCVKTALKEFHHDNPYAVFFNPLSQRISAYIRMVILAICPILNFLALLGYVLTWDNMVTVAYDKIAEMAK